MKIIKFYEQTEEPNDCCKCKNEYDGNLLNLSLFKGFMITISLCDNCLNKLRKDIKNG